MEINNRTTAEQVIDAHYGYDGNLSALSDEQVIEEAEDQLHRHNRYVRDRDMDAADRSR